MCFRASVLLRKASALKRIDVRYGPQNANRARKCKIDFLACFYYNIKQESQK